MTDRPHRLQQIAVESWLRVLQGGVASTASDSALSLGYPCCRTCALSLIGRRSVAARPTSLHARLVYENRLPWHPVGCTRVSTKCRLHSVNSRPLQHGADFKLISTVGGFLCAQPTGAAG